MSIALGNALRKQGIDILTVQGAKMVERKDLEQLEYATSQHRVLSTYNAKDFYKLHTQFLELGRHHAGLILIPQQTYSIGELTRRLLNLTTALTAEDMQDRAEFLSNWK